MHQEQKVILTYGTFDLLHVGHIRLLKRIKKIGGYLIVGLSTDEFNILKGKKSIYSYEDRKEILESISYVDHIIPERCWEQKIEDINYYKVDMLVMGDDWVGKFDFLSNHTEVIYLPRTQNISTTSIKSVIRKSNEEKKQLLENLTSQLSNIVQTL